MHASTTYAHRLPHFHTVLQLRNVLMASSVVRRILQVPHTHLLLQQLI